MRRGVGEFALVLGLLMIRILSRRMLSLCVGGGSVVLGGEERVGILFASVQSLLLARGWLLS